MTKPDTKPYTKSDAKPDIKSATQLETKLSVTIISTMEKIDPLTHAIFDENKFLSLLPSIFSQEFESHLRNAIFKGKRLQAAKEEFASKKLIEVISSKSDSEYYFKPDSKSDFNINLANYFDNYFNNSCDKFVCKSMFAASVFGVALRLHSIAEGAKRASVSGNPAANKSATKSLIIYNFNSQLKPNSQPASTSQQQAAQINDESSILQIFAALNINASVGSANAGGAKPANEPDTKKIAKIITGQSIVNQIEQNKTSILSGEAFICGDQLINFAHKTLSSSGKPHSFAPVFQSVVALLTKILTDKSEFYLKARIISLCGLLHQLANPQCSQNQHENQHEYEYIKSLNKLFNGRYVSLLKIREDIKRIEGKHGFELLLISKMAEKRRALLQHKNQNEKDSDSVGAFANNKLDCKDVWRNVSEIITFSINELADKTQPQQADEVGTNEIEQTISKIDDFFANAGTAKKTENASESAALEDAIDDAVNYFLQKNMSQTGNNAPITGKACSKFLFFSEEAYIYKGDFAIKDAFKTLASTQNNYDSHNQAISGDLFGDNAPQEYLSSASNEAQDCANDASAIDAFKNIIDSASFKSRCINDVIFHMSQHDEVQFCTIEKGLSGESASHERIIFKLKETLKQFNWSFELYNSPHNKPHSSPHNKAYSNDEAKTPEEAVGKLPIFGAPQLQFRPKILAATSVELLIKHPFVFYLKHVLNLKKMDYEPQMASVKGNALHDAAKEIAEKIAQQTTQQISNDKEYFKDIDKKAAQYYARYYGLSVIDAMYVEKAAKEIADFCEEYASKGYQLVPEKEEVVDIEIAAKTKKEDGTQQEAQRISVSARCDLALKKPASPSPSQNQNQHENQNQRLNANQAIIIVDYKTGSTQSMSFADFKKCAQLATEGMIFKRQSGGKIEIENLMYIKPSLTEELDKKESKPKTKANETQELIDNFEAFFINEMQEYYTEDEYGELKKYLFDESVAISNHEVQYFHIARVGDFLFSR